MRHLPIPSRPCSSRAFCARLHRNCTRNRATTITIYANQGYMCKVCPLPSTQSSPRSRASGGSSSSRTIRASPLHLRGQAVVVSRSGGSLASFMPGGNVPGGREGAEQPGPMRAEEVRIPRILMLMHRWRNAGDQLAGVVGERVADDRLHFGVFQAMMTLARSVRAPEMAASCSMVRCAWRRSGPAGLLAAGCARPPNFV
jgi:hypothetical protein